MQLTSFLNDCYTGNLPGVKNYVENLGKNPYEERDVHGRTGLFHAVLGNQIETVDYLLKVAPGIETISTKSFTYPQTVAIMQKDKKMIGLFLATMPAADFSGKLKQLQYPRESILVELLEPLAVKQLTEMCDTPAFRKSCEMHRAVRREVKSEPEIKHKPSTTNHNLSSLHCVIRLKKSSSN